jgi:thiamine transport system permease protein
MQHQTQILPKRPGRLATGTTIALAVAGLIALVLWAILAAATDIGQSARVDVLHLVRMTSIQAGLSTLLSLLVGMALAWSLDRLRFPGRALVVAVLGAAIVTPGIVVAFGLLTIWGRNGWVNRAADALFGAPIGNIAFGLGGILIAHTVLNGAFAARVLLARLDAVPQARLKIGQSLGLSAIQRFTLIDWPAMRGSLPGLGAIIFLLTFTSFPIVLLLGGGPANQTLEVAIYAAVRQDFDLRGAVILASTQIALCATIIAMTAALPPVPTSFTRIGPSRRWNDGVLARVLQGAVLAIGLVGFIAPLLAVLVDGMTISGLDTLASASFWRATLTSLWIGTASAILTLGLALGIAMARAAAPGGLQRTLIGMPAYAYLAVPAVVLSLGFFLLVRSMGVAPTLAAAPVVVLANALLALPFAIATIGPPLDAIMQTRGKLIRTLGLGGWRQFTAIDYPLLGRDIGIVLALAFCFSFGDLGVIALFGTQDFQTLPLLMYGALGSYRSNDAAVIAAVLLLGSILAFIGLPRLIERLSHARS